MTAPSIIITGIRRSGLNLLADMLREGGVPESPPFAISGEGLRASGFCLAVDPQSTDYLPFDKKHRIGLFVDRSSRQMIRSIVRDNAEEGRTALAAHEIRILRRQLVCDLRRARDRAAFQFSPLFVFSHDAVIADPALAAERLGFILADHYPKFDERRASLAVRRIVHVPRVIDATPRLVVVQP
jgi:hypothetical protein